MGASLKPSGVIHCAHVQRHPHGGRAHLKLGLDDDAAEGGWFREWRKSSTGAANAKSDTAPTSSAPVPTSVCFSRLITGFTCGGRIHSSVTNQRVNKANSVFWGVVFAIRQRK